MKPLLLTLLITTTSALLTPCIADEKPSPPVAIHKTIAKKKPNQPTKKQASSSNTAYSSALTQ